MVRPDRRQCGYEEVAENEAGGSTLIIANRENMPFEEEGENRDGGPVIDTVSCTFASEA